MMEIEDIEHRILRACKTLRALPDHERKFQRIHNLWPDVVQDIQDAYGWTEERMPRFRPTPADVSDCLTALEWARCLEKREWRLVWWRSYDVSFRQIAWRIGRSDDTARRRFDDAVRKMWYFATKKHPSVDKRAGFAA